MIKIKHNLDANKFKWLWCKYVQAGNDEKHCTNSLKGKYSKKFSKHNDINGYEYQKYENYDAIEVPHTDSIPSNYDGVLGVPITFLDKYNPEQFEIVALCIVRSCEFTSNRKMEILDKNGNPTGKYTMNAKGTLYRKFVEGKDKKPSFKDAKNGELYSSIYARILIRFRR